MKDISFLSDMFKLYYEKGLQARDNGNVELAKKNLLLAAQTMFKMAKESNGELKRARFERATRISDIANNLSEENVARPKPVKKNSSIAGDAKQVTKNNEDESETNWQTATIPNIKFEDVAGLEEVKASVRRRIILPMQHPEIYEKYNKKVGGGILLYGPPGTGKTMIAKAIANEVGAKFYAVKCSDIVSKWFGEAEKNIKNLFETARADERAIIFFDEFEALAAKRGGNSTVMNRLVPELLAQIQGFNDNTSQLLILAATNRPWDIDSAMLRPGRFNELLYIPLPDAPARKYLIERTFKDIKLASDVDIDYIVEMTEGYNCSDVNEVCDRSKDNPIELSINSPNDEIFPITRADIEYALNKVKSSVQASEMADFVKFMENKL